MKRVILIALAFMLAMGADAKPKQHKEIDLRIGTYNVWAHYARRGLIKKGKAVAARSWDNSKEAVARLIVDLDCDLMGLQEVSNVCYEDLATLLKKVGGKKYGVWWLNTYPEGHRRNVGNAIVYNKKMIELAKKNIYYFSPTPEVRSSGWDEMRYIRAALVTEVTHKKSGRKLYFMATHGPLGDVACGHAGRLLTEFDQKYNTEGLPTIVVGDMNARPGDMFYNNMTKYFEDSYLVAEKKCSTIGTFNSSRESEKNFKNSHFRIDHIYVHSTDKGKIAVKEYNVSRDKLNCGGEMHYPSDHNPVYVDIKIK
ncbi:MAG: endonuclease/exonuclease/phosphatase family protein [Alistipes sp.]|nr:endonuclease/exonuclease/phosphatase family protein [Alistipes sp.]